MADNLCFALLLVILLWPGGLLYAEWARPGTARYGRMPLAGLPKAGRGARVRAALPQRSTEVQQSLGSLSAPLPQPLLSLSLTRGPSRFAEDGMTPAEGRELIMVIMAEPSEVVTQAVALQPAYTRFELR